MAAAATALVALSASPQTTIGVFLRQAQVSPSRAFLYAYGAGEWRAITWGEARQQLVRLASGLLRAGVQAGDAVLLLSQNRPEWILCDFAIQAAGGITVPVYPTLSAETMQRIAADSEAVLAIAASELAGKVSPAGRLRQLIDMDRDLPEWLRDDPEPVALDEVMRRTAALSGEDVATIIYTSGTTGDPKGVMLTHRNLLYIAKVSSTLRALRAGDRVYGVLPMSHIYGLASVTLGTLFAGASLQVEARFSPQAMLKAIARCGVTVLQGVPSMYAKLLESLPAETAPLDVPQLRMCFAGGSPLDPALKAQTERVLGVTLHNGYGLTEASPTVAHTRLDAPRTDCAVGPPLPGVEIRIGATAGGNAAVGEPGTLHVRGPNVMRGYYRNPELTAQAIDADGWLDTGDIARQDASGALFIVGRAKELIIHSGFNVYPAEVEAVLNAHPSVVHSAVVGREIPGNEEVVAFVELAPGKNATPAELDRYAAGELAPYKRPAEIIVVASLPVAANGKILKHRLAELAQRAAPDTAAARWLPDSITSQEVS